MHGITGKEIGGYIAMSVKSPSDEYPFLLTKSFSLDTKKWYKLLWVGQ